MQQLISQYSISEIILFIVLLSLSLRKLVEFVDWVRKRAQQAVQDSNKPYKLEEALKQREQEARDIKHDLNQLEKLIRLLIESDKDDIKQSITRWHHYYCYEVGKIDDYSLDCLEKRYSHYQDEGGNSFITTLMQELRTLPRQNRKQ